MSTERALIPHPLRLGPGADLRKELARFVMERGFTAACVVAAVGSLSVVRLRLAGRDDAHEVTGDHELLSLCGTFACGGHPHLHATVADRDGFCLGGHLLDGALVRTTAELVIGELRGVTFERRPDAATGYAELVVT